MHSDTEKLYTKIVNFDAEKLWLFKNMLGFTASVVCECLLDDIFL
jgi:hypothetical protein